MYLKLLAASCAGAFAILLTGCGGNAVATPPPPPPPTEPNSCKTVDTTSPPPQPLAAASLMLYGAGTGGNGSGASAVTITPLITGANGTFDVRFTCPFSNTVLYAVVTSATNPGVQLAAILGTCGSIGSGASFTINEATTVAAAYAMSQFFSVDPISLAATSTNSSGIALAAATAAHLADPTSGSSSFQKINSLANLLNTCAASSGDASMACQNLFTAAYGAAGKGPSETAGETFGAVISLAKSAGTNVASIFTLSQASNAYQTALASAPADWTLLLNYTGGGMNGPSAISIDSIGRVWVSSYFASTSLFSNTGTPVYDITGNHLENSFGGAVDVNDAFWVANEESSSSVNNGLGSLSVFNSAGTLEGHYIAGGINFPLAVAFDTSGVAWVVDYGDSSLTLLDASGNPLSGTDGYSATNLVFPVAVATDAKCNAYVANQSSNTVTLVIADGSSFKDFVVGQGPSGIAIDAGGNIWSANYYGDSVGLVSVSGDVLSGPGFAGGGLDHPQGIAPDGAGHVWVANYRASGITELAPATSANPGAVLSPADGWAADSGISEAFGLAIDASGNVWVTGFGNNTLTELVGIAAPVQTPLLGPVRVP
jgi:sugar lactone lactonase YvrE